jgi:transposase
LARRARHETATSDLFLNEAEALAAGCEAAQESAPEDDVEIGPHKCKKRGRKRLDPMLPREVVRHELPETERVCARDGSALMEISEQFDIVPQQVRVIQHQRIKYACPCCDHGIKVTPVPAHIISKGLLTESALA